MLTVNKNRILYFVKIISMIVLLLVVPLNLRAVPIPTDAQNYNWQQILQEAERDYNKNPNSETKSKLATAYNNYGLLFAHKGEWVHAEAYLNKALQIDPEAEAIKQNLSRIYFEHAYALYQDKNRTYYTNYAHQDAKNLLNKAIALNPANVNAYLLLGDIEYMNQQMSAAKRAWEKAAALVPSNQQLQDRLEQISREAEAESNMRSVFDPFFIIKVEPEVAENTDLDIAKMLSDIRTKVSRDFQYTQTKKLPVIVYTKNQYLDTIEDAPDWSEAAYDGKLRIAVSMGRQNMSQLYSNVVHEYTHAVLDQITNRNMPKWLNEGIAKYEEYKHGIKPRIYVLALAYNTDNILPWNSIDDSFLSPVKSEALLAYQQSFSFVFYLVERYGMSKLIKLLKTLGTGANIETAFQTAYNKPLEAIQNDWRIWLASFIQRWAEASSGYSY